MPGNFKLQVWTGQKPYTTKPCEGFSADQLLRTVQHRPGSEGHPITRESVKKGTVLYSTVQYCTVL